MCLVYTIDMNTTLAAFNSQQRTVYETQHWAVVVRPQQVTLGCLVLIEKSDATSLADVSPQSASELPQVVAAIETALMALWQPQKYNYLALMMVDPNVHFHVIPRYDQPRTVDGVTFTDAAFPKPPQLADVHQLDEQQLDALQQMIAAQITTQENTHEA